MRLNIAIHNSPFQLPLGYYTSQYFPADPEMVPESGFNYSSITGSYLYERITDTPPYYQAHNPDEIVGIILRIFRGELWEHGF